jgi:hypothetical protein
MPWMRRRGEAHAMPVGDGEKGRGMSAEDERLKRETEARVREQLRRLQLLEVTVRLAQRR